MAERRKLETILTANKLVSEEQLKQAVDYAQAVSIDLVEAVLQKKFVSPEAVMTAYAESVGLPFIHLADVAIDEDVAAQVDPMTARKYSFVPVSIDQDYVLLATTKPIIPDVADELRMIFDLPVRCAICTPAELSAAIAKYYPRGAARMVKAERVKVPPLQSQTVKKKSKPVKPMSDEDKRDRYMKTWATFNFTLAFVCFASYCLPGSWRMAYSFWSFFLFGVFAGCGAALMVWKTLSR